MQGKIIAYSDAVNAGFILGTDGKNYQFSKKEWEGENSPKNNEVVSFNGKTGRALQVKNVKS